MFSTGILCGTDTQAFDGKLSMVIGTDSFNVTASFHTVASAGDGLVGILIARTSPCNMIISRNGLTGLFCQLIQDVPTRIGFNISSDVTFTTAENCDVLVCYGTGYSELGWSVASDFWNEYLAILATKLEAGTRITRVL